MKVQRFQLWQKNLSVDTFQALLHLRSAIIMAGWFQWSRVLPDACRPTQSYLYALRHVPYHLPGTSLVAAIGGLIYQKYIPDTRLRLIGLCNTWPRPCRLPSGGFVYLRPAYYYTRALPTSRVEDQQGELRSCHPACNRGKGEPVEPACM